MKQFIIDDFDRKAISNSLNFFSDFRILYQNIILKEKFIQSLTWHKHYLV